MKLRSSFDFSRLDVAKWFPGHMRRGMRQLDKIFDKVDGIVEVHDARIPLSGRNPLFHRQAGVRSHILVLNKMDLADLSYEDSVKAHLRQQGVPQVLYADLRSHANAEKIIPEIVSSIQRNSTLCTKVTTLNLVVAGIPNVGKSSLLNAIRHIYTRLGNATRVGAIPGITRSVLNKIKVCDKPLTYVYDSPGILQPSGRDPESFMKLAACATINPHVAGEEAVCDYILYWLNKHGLFSYVERFGLKEPTDDINVLLEQVSATRNLVIKRRLAGSYYVRPDLTNAARIVVKSFQNGEFGKVNLDCDLLEPSSIT